MYHHTEPGSACADHNCGPEPAVDSHHDEWEREYPKEECGVFGIYAPKEEVARVSFFGLFALQHRGQESAGLAVSNGSSIEVHKDMGLVTHVFDEPAITKLKGHIAIGHTRYSTTGSSIKCNAQPLTGMGAAGEIAVAHNGNLVNTRELRDELISQGIKFETTNDSEVIAQMLALHYTGSVEDAVTAVMKRLKGAYSLVILTQDKLVGVRDPYGIRPLCIGQLEGEQYVIASESCALVPVGATYVRDIEPGEVVVVDHNGIREFQAVPMVRSATCLFEFIYFARPDTILYGKSLHESRRRMGYELAKEHPCPGADVVIPVPDTSIAAAIGYAEASKIRYAEGIIKNRYIQRTFIQPSKHMRELGARMKYSPIRETLANRKVVVVDDSIVRGTTTGKLIKMLYDAGAKEVHVRITAPPVKNPCYYGIDMADQKELVAAKYSVDQIRDMIGATSLGYLSLDGVVKAINIGKDKFCRACFDGRYPIQIPAALKNSKLMLENTHAATDPDITVNSPEKCCAGGKAAD
jgi:amidophosphoribosyltransferase